MQSLHEGSFYNDSIFVLFLTTLLLHEPCRSLLLLFINISCEHFNALFVFHGTRRAVE